MIRNADVASFLAGRRIAVVGASDDRNNFGRTVVAELRDHGYEVVPVNPVGEPVAGLATYPTLADVPDRLDGVIVMVNATRSADVVRDALAAGADKVWLFKGIGGPGAVSDESIAVAEAGGATVVAGACPLMFLEPVGWFHRCHRAVRRAKGEVERPAA